MPQITVKGLTDKQMRAISTPLIPKLAEAIGCPGGLADPGSWRTAVSMPGANRCPDSPL